MTGHVVTDQIDTVSGQATAQNQTGGAAWCIIAASSSASVAPSNANTLAYAASLIVKATPGTLFRVTGYNSKGSTQFIQVHDSATLPADTAVPKIVITAPATGNFSIDLTGFGRAFAAGIVICNSSTGPTKTIGSADCWFDVQYA